MLSVLINRIFESINILRSGGIKQLVKRYIYFNNIWVIVEKEVKDFRMNVSADTDSFNFIKITKDNFYKNMLSDDEAGHYFRIQSYLKKGYQGYMLIQDSILLGYIWFSLIDKDVKHYHPDVKYIDIDYNEPCVYMFDMFLRKSVRGKNIGSFIFGSLLQLLKNNGIVKAYGFYEAKNIPALWVHRLFKCKEMKRINVSQVIFYKIVKKEPVASGRNI